MASASAPDASNPSANAKENQSSTNETSTASRRSRPGNPNFEQLCVDNKIYPRDYEISDTSGPPQPANLDDIRKFLSRSSESLSRPALTPEAFRKYRSKVKSISEGKTMRTVIPLITGDFDIADEGELPFKNLSSITGKLTSNPVPDFYDGAKPSALEIKVREDLFEYIVPNKWSGMPVAPNFFFEVKAPKRTYDVAEAQAMLDGAHGALGMHKLQNYLLDSTEYDGKAYTYSASFANGTLKLFAHHLAAPQKAKDNPSYYITLIDGFFLDSESTFFRGVEALRNLRAKAKEDRDALIDQANERARAEVMDNEDTEREEESVSTPRQQDENANSVHSYDVFVAVDDDVQGDDQGDDATQEKTHQSVFLHGILNGNEAGEPQSDIASSFNSTPLPVDPKDLSGQAQPKKTQRRRPSSSSPQKPKKRSQGRTKRVAQNIDYEDCII